MVEGLKFDIDKEAVTLISKLFRWSHQRHMAARDSVPQWIPEHGLFLKKAMEELCNFRSIFKYNFLLCAFNIHYYWVMIGVICIWLLNIVIDLIY